MYPKNQISGGPVLKNHISRGLIVGVLTGFFVHMLVSLNMIAWVAFAAASLCFILGGTPEAVLKVSGCVSCGTLLGMCMSLLAGVLTPTLGSIAFPLAVGLLCVPLFVYEKIPFLDFIPAHFMGCAIFFASGLTASSLTFYKVFSAAVFGSLFGFVLAFAIQKYVVKFLTPVAEPAKKEDGTVIPFRKEAAK